MDKNVDLHDDEHEIVEEDLKDAEAASVKSVDAAGDAVKKNAPKRKGDKSNSEAPKTAAGKIGAMYDKMKSLSKESLDVAFDKVMDEDFELVATDVEEEAELESYDFSEDLKSCLESEATLSEDFKAQTATIFEMAINSKVKAVRAEIEESVAVEVEAFQADLKEEMVSNIDAYLDYVVEKWLDDNKLAVEVGLRTEIAEGFMSNLKDLFEQSYVSVPESKVDLVDELAEHVEDLEARLNDSIADEIALEEELELFRREAIVRESAEGLTDTQFEKLVAMAEDIESETMETFAEKVAIVAGSLFEGQTVTSSAELDDLTEDVDHEVEAPSGVMAQYVNTITKQTRKL